MEFQILRLSKGDGSVRDFRGVVRRIIPYGTAVFFLYDIFPNRNTSFLFLHRINTMYDMLIACKELHWSIQE